MTAADDERSQHNIIPLGERHLRVVLRDFVEHYHAERNHQAWTTSSPSPPAIRPRRWAASADANGSVACSPSTSETPHESIAIAIWDRTGYARSAFVDTKPEEFESVWRAGPRSLLLCGQEAATQMLEQSGGAIVAVGATASLGGGEIFTSFAAAKAAHRSLAQSMARGLRPRGIHVAYVVIDGAVDGLVRQLLRTSPTTSSSSPAPSPRRSIT